MSNSFHVRWMIRRDLPEVLALAPGVTENTILGYLRERNKIGLVVEAQPETGETFYPIIGWVVYSMHKNRLRIEQMFGSADAKASILAKMVDKVSGSSRRARVNVRVRLDDLDTIALLKDFGFWGWPDTDDTVDFVYRKVNDRGELVTDCDDDETDTDLVSV